ncbi:hypothetical protein LZ017_19110 [Pelomonas sp. CA6]|uniref:hypothetical protein n=1 Tax=Pelomonas sp. CA6 TaxID=2907999 RepID=UPI001F4C2DBE|nr:hypothetical protein [Pelomonas sp. CA6]MCH7345491.1 hypothetical protein [Pelomonas sp. CA6]
MRAAPAFAAQACILGAVLRSMRLWVGVVGPILAVMVLLALVVGTWLLKFALALGLLLCACLWWAAITALMQQNHPVHARLVPGHVRRLREVAVALLLGCSLLFAMVGLPLGGSFWLWWIGGVALLVLTQQAMRHPWLWWAMWLPLALADGWKGWAPVRALVATAQWVFALRPMTLTLVLLLIAAAWVASGLERGGSRHALRHARGKAWLDRANRGLEGGFSLLDPAWRRQEQARGSRLLPALGACLGWLNRGLLSWRIRHARPTASSALARAEMATLKQLHWSALTGAVLLIVPLLALGYLLLQPVLGWPPLTSPRLLRGAGLSIALASMLVNPMLGIVGALHRSRREQAMLMLLPGMPRGAALARGLARRLMGGYLICWLLSMAGVALIYRASGQGASTVALSFAAATLPAGVLMLWRDWARQGALPPWFVPALVGLTLVGLAGLEALRAWLSVPAWGLPLISAAVAGLLGLWRWRAMTRGAPPWPVGRWAPP